jgi:hypothetical protein
VNHTVSGVRLRSNSVPAVTDVRLPQAAHLYRPSATAHPPPCPHFGQTKPPGHRSQSRKSRQSASVANQDWNSPVDLG